jgi:hypothetical protein
MTIEVMDSSKILDVRSLPFYDSGTQKIYDHSGYSHHQTEFGYAGNDSEIVDGPTGQALYHNGNKCLRLNNSDFDFTMQNFSIEVWANSRINGLDRFLFSKYAWNTDGYVFYLTIPNEMQFRTFQGGANQATASTASYGVSDGNYHQYVATRNDTSVKLYRDGAEVAYNAIGVHVNPIAPTSRDCNICYYSEAGGFGYHKQTTVWIRAIGSAEIYERYLAGMAGRL